MKRFPAASLIATTLMVTMLVLQVSCAPDQAEGLDENDGKSEIKLGQAPSAEDAPRDGAGDLFPFCEGASAYKANNAAWLAFMSLLQFEHFGTIGPVLHELGFGQYIDDVGEGNYWGHCAEDLETMRDIEKDEDADLRATLQESKEFSCARDWYALSQLDQDELPEGLLAPIFEDTLVRRVHPDAYIEFWSGESAQVMWAQHRSDPYVIISFRGLAMNSGVAADILSALDTDKVTFDGTSGAWGKVHQGFDRALEQVFPLIEAKLEEVKAQGEELAIWVTGHGTGGALANLLAARLAGRSDLPPISGVYTFGATRVGDEGFTARFNEAAVENNSPLWRVRFEEDLAAQYPFSFFKQSYAHAGSEVRLTKGGDFEIIDPGEDEMEAVDAKIAIQILPMAQYYERMEQILTAEDRTDGAMASCAAH